MLPFLSTEYFMQDLRNKELEELIDLLAQYTAKYSRLVTQGSDDDEYWECKHRIRLLQEEIEKKKKILDASH